MGSALLCGALALPAPPGAMGEQNPADGTIRGQVIDDASGRPLPSAAVDIVDEVGRIRSRVTTDQNGHFLHTRIQPGAFRLRVRAAGYQESLSPRWWIETGEVLSVVLRIHPEAILLAPLEITARTSTPSPVLQRFYERLDRGLGGVFFSRSEIEARNAMRISDLLAEVPGIVLQGSASGGDPRRDQVVRFSRALGGCPAQIYLDGVPANRGGAALPVDALASPASLEGIEVYRGLSGVPAEFLSPESRCGVVALWTRRGGSQPRPEPSPRP